MTNTAEADASTGRVAVLASICLAALILPLSFSGGAVATPAIGRELGGSAAALSWITNAFMLSFGSLLMAAGALADAYGRKRLFASGVAGFAVISLGLSLAPSLIVLDLLRAAQGVAAAAALAGGSSALAQEFEGPARLKAFSLLGTTFGVGLALGPILAGYLAESFGWRAIFLSSLVVAVLALFFGVPRMRESRDPSARGLDWPGTLAFTLMLSLFTFAVIEAPDRGWTNVEVVALLGAAALSLAAFILIEGRVRRPMLDLGLFRYPRFIGVQVLPVATCYSYVVLLVLLPLRFIGIEGYGEAQAGSLMIALSAPMLVVPLLAAMLTRFASAGTLSAIGLAIAAIGLLWLGRIAPGQGAGALAPAMLLIGFGTGLPWGLMDALSVSVVPKERAGMATGIFSTVRVAGEGIALALVGAILAELARHSLAGPASSTDAGPHIAEAAHRLANGDLLHASEALSAIGRPLLVQAYAEAFRQLADLLAAITVASALIVLAFLGRRTPSSSLNRKEERAIHAEAPMIEAEASTAFPSARPARSAGG